MSETPTSVLWEITVRLVLLSDTHVGPADPAHRRADEPGSDLPVDRDPETGLPRLRATTLAGVLRHDLVARTGDTASAGALFGTSAADDPARTGFPGALDLDDAEGRVPTAITSRTGNRVDPASGTALPGHLWRREILPAGTVFISHLRLHVSALEDEREEGEEAVSLGRLTACVAGLYRGHTGPGTPGSDAPGLHVGARTGRGHGAIAATSWSARRHDLTTAEGWFAHHARTWSQRRADGENALTDGSPTLTEALVRALRSADRPDLADGIPATAPDRGPRDELRLTLAVGEPDDPLLPAQVRPGLLMIADPPPPDRVGAVDRAHRRRLAEGAPEPAPVLGDTALHALLKRLSARLSRDACEALGGHEDLWRHWHAQWWGGDTDPVTALPRPSRVRLRRTPVLTGGAPLTTTRLTVDSLFGDAVDGHLSTSDVHCGGTAEAVLDVYDPDDSVRGLLTLLVRDLATVPADTLGSGAGSGHGRLTATAATLTVRTGDCEPPRTVDLLTAVLDPESADARLARGWVSRWHARLEPRAEGEAER
ncbi:RAMP superfamily CRISPR-associated protein [Nocardiopsis salina]|uniref:RAMP superfamily CRISPR-associated protein n=1 Tax=Nocardiopsis salina TaxID=245836 RepID=UPI00034777B1|nr:RAMP superfamily CRISPR-associated protein [Nocardiopsis salina]